MRHNRENDMASLQRTPVYISYSKKDPYWRSITVSTLERFGFEVLYDDNPSPAEEWNPDPRIMRERARIAVLLVSQNFIESKRIQSEDLPHLLHLRKTKGLQVFPVLIGESSWQNVAELSEIQTFPEDGPPLQRGMEARTHMQMQKLAERIVEVANSLGPNQDSLEIANSLGIEVKRSSNWLDAATIDRFSDQVRTGLRRANELRSEQKRPAVSTFDLAAA